MRPKVSEKLSKDKKPVIKKLSYRGEQILGLILFSIILAISIFFKETPGSRRGRAFTQEGDPEMYWFLVSLWILGVIYFLYKLIKDIVTNPKEQQKTPPLS